MKNELHLSYLIDGFEDITPEEITALTGVAADIVWIKGQPKLPRLKSVAHSNRWLVKAKYQPTKDFDMECLDKQMKYLMDVLNSNKDVFKMLGQKYNCEILCGIYIYTDSKESTPWIHLTKEHNHFLSEYNLEFDVDIILLAEE